MSVREMNEEHELLSHDRLGVSTRINGMGASGEPKNFPPVLVSSSGQPVLVHQQLVQGEHGVIPIASPFLTQASVFYAPSFLNRQQLAVSHHGSLHQFTHISPLVPLHNNFPREGCSNAPNGCIQNESLQPRSDSTSLSNCKKNKSASPTSVNSMKQKGREQTSLCAASAVTTASISPGTPTSPQTPTTPQQTEPSPVGDEICVICSDKATGHHYGVTSCEGCKGFFKRSVQNKKVYSCRNLTQDCPVDKRHRNRCQFCRFQKCVKAGMLKEAVREDRTPGGKHKNRSLSFQSRVKPEPAKVARTNSSGSSISSMEPVQSPSTSSSTPSKTFPVLITELLRHEPCGSQLFDECAGCELEDVGQKTLAHVTQRAEEQVQKNQEWFTNLPFLQDINDRDQRILIRSAWIEMMLINLTKHSFHFENSVLLCKGQVLDFPTAQATGIGDIMHRVMQLTAKFKELNLDSAEFVCIKIIVLLNPDVKGLHDQPLIERLQDKVHASLLDYNNSFYPSEPNRFGNILLRLPELRSIGTKCLERLFMLNLTGQIRASNSLSELLHSTKR